MSAHSTNVVEKTLEALNDLKLVARVLELVDAHFRGIPSLREISVDVYEDSERSFGNYDEEDYNFYDNDYDDDDDYKNDSNCWRRQSD